MVISLELLELNDVQRMDRDLLLSQLSCMHARASVTTTTTPCVKAAWCMVWHVKCALLDWSFCRGCMFALVES